MVVAGGCDYYPGSATSSPGFSFAVTRPARRRRGRPARADRAAAQAARRRGAARAAEAPAAAAAAAHDRRRSPARRGKARDDILAALARRGWAGRLVWALRARAGPPRGARDRARARRPRGRRARSRWSIVARGGGSLADLLCFCDETLCRTVALLSVPVIASVGHHTDRTLLDDVAAVSCSTPTHAAEAAVAVDCGRRARGRAPGESARRRRCAARQADGAALPSTAVARARARAAAGALARARRAPRPPARAPAPAAARDPRRLAAAARRRARPSRGTRALVLARKAGSTLRDCRERRPRELEQLALALAGHDPAAHARARLRAGAAPRTASRCTSAAQARGARRAVRCASPTAAARSRRVMSREREPRSGREAARRASRLQPTRHAAARVEEIIRRLDSGEASLQRDARAGQRGQGADRAVRRRAERGRRARWRSCGWTSSSPPGERGGRMSTWELLAELPLEIEDYALEPLQAEVSSELRAQEHGIRCAARARRASARTSPTTRSTRRSCRPPARRCRSRGASRSASFCEHLARPRRCSPSRRSARSPRATALGVRVGGAGPGAAPGRARRCTRRSRASPQPVRFVVSLRLGEPPSLRAAAQAARSSTRGCASSSTRRAPGMSA